MMSHDQKEEMKKLIKNGFDIELISFEFDIPIEELIQLKKEINNQVEDKVDNKTDNKEKRVSPKTLNVKKVSSSTSIKTKSSYSKLRKMRENYKALYYGSSKAQNLQFKELTPQEIEIINSSIDKMEEDIRKIQGATRKEKRASLKHILDMIEKIKKYTLTVEQSEKIVSILQSEELESLRFDTEDRLGIKLYNTKKTMARKHTDAIDILIFQAKSVDELKVLQRKITSKMEMEDQIFYGRVKRKINDKVLKIQQQQAIDRIRNDVPISILRIVSDLANGTLDIQEANEVIEEEAKRRVKSKPKTRFSLTEEQEKRQILIQIRTAIEDRTDQYRISDPETTTMQLQQLCGDNSLQALSTVVGSLINSKDFDAARSVYNKFSTESRFTIDTNGLMKRIRNAEISDMILKVINMNEAPDKEVEYFEKIEAGLKSRSIKLASISLGKSKDGLRNISLADVWPDQNKREKINII